MAKLLNKDPITYQKERDSFLRELRQFHDSRGTPLRRVPKVHGHEVDLYLLYVLVTAHGGWEKVNIRCEWDSLSEQFGVPRNCVNGGIALKQIYIRFLERYEKLHFLGEGLDRDDEDEEGEGSRRRWSARVLHSVPLAYNHHQHNVSDQARQAMGLSTDLYKGSEYDRLALSLVSPLPNEHDFAMNVCTLLSNEGKHTLRLEKCPRLVDFLLAHAGVYNHGSLRDVFKDMFKHMRHQSMDQFWCDIVDGVNFRQLTEPPNINRQVSSTPPPPTSPSALLPESSDERLQDSQSSAPQDTISDSATEVPRTQENDNNDCEMVDVSEDKVDKENKPKIRMIDVADEDMPTLPVVNEKPLFCPPPSQENEVDQIFSFEDRELFCLGRGLGTQDPLAQRIIQVATIMRNLSFEEDNIPVLGRNATFIRFSLLCMESRYSCLSQLGMDMLSQVVGEMVLEDPQSDKIVALLLSTVTQGLSSPDRFITLSCLDVLNKLCQNEKNEEVMLKCLEQKVYEQVCSFLTLHDIMLLIYTLECLYSLSSLGEKACNSIVRVHGAIDTLVSLITVEAQSYGPRACILMRVVERLPDQSAQQSSSTGNSVGAISSLGTQTTTLTPMTTVNPVTPARQPVTIVSRQANATPQRQIIGTPVSVVAQTTSTIPTLVQSPQQLQQQHQQQQQLQENEQFALAWLRATYELSAGHSVEQTELYRQYLASCAKIGRRGVIASLHFPRCVRSVFGGSVGPIAKQPVTPGTTPEYHYDGIKVRKSAVPLLAAPSNNPANVPVQIRQPSTPTPPPAPESPAPSITTAEPIPPSISPILKAQLSAPPKQVTKPEAKSQVLAHPHLTQALLGSSSQQAASQSSQQSQGSNPSSPTPSGSTTNPTPSTSSTSLIKSLLASKVAQRQQQQRLLQQQLQSGQPLQPPTPNTSNLPPPSPQNSPPPLQLINTKAPTKPTILRTVIEPKSRQIARVNGARSLQSSNSATQSDLTNNSNDKKNEINENHILPPPPPKPRLDEDSNSAASTANSLVSSSGAVSTDGDGENSLTSFEGILLNGIPNPLDIDAANDATSNDGSRSCDSSKGSSLKMKGMLADLLEKKVVTKEPVINGVVGKELRISDKGLELVENHVDKILKQENDVNKTETAEQIKLGLKRSASSASDTPDAKKPLLNPPINGNAHTSEVNDNEIKTEEKVEPVKQEMTPASAVRQLILAQPANTESATNQQGQQLIVGSRQIIVAPGSLPQGQMMISQNQLGKGQFIVQQAQRQVLVQNPQMLVSSGQMVSQPVLVGTQSGGSQFIVTQALQGALGASGQTYMLAQPQGLVQGQAPTVLVTQTPQQQGTNAKTIIILHQQGGQKMMTQQGQQVMLQLPRTAVSGNALQGLTLSQGAGGQMTVTLPGNSKATNILQVPRTVATSTPGKPVATSAIVANPAMKIQLSSNAVTSSIQSKPTTTSCTSVPPRPSTPRTPGADGEARNSNSPAPSTSANSQKPAIEIPTSPFLCEWRGCMRSFKSANEVYMHACQSHCPTGPEDVQCLWERCDAMKRKRFSLMTHLHDRHCNNEVLRMMAVRRKQMAQSGRSEIPPPAPPPPHPGYAPNAALHAIKRHALEFVNPKELMQRAAAAPPSSSSTVRSGSTPAAAPPPAPSRPPTTGPSPAEQNAEASAARRLSFQDDNEGPVTKSIRLTSSLILRNLVIYSTNGRRFLRSYEPHLASVALSNVESSRTIAQVLYDMSQRPEQS